MPRTPPDLSDVLSHIDALKRRRTTRTTLSSLADLEARASALSAPIYVLPVELVSHIFILAAREDRRFPLTASQVSRPWRAIAQGYAPLWSGIRIPLPTPKPARPPTPLSSAELALSADEEDEELLFPASDEDEADYQDSRQLAELQYFLTRSGQSTLSVQLEWAERASSSKFITLLQPQIIRCAYLRLINRGPALPHLSALAPCPGPSKLQALDLAGFCIEHIDDLLHTLAHCPHLRTLALRDVHWSHSRPLSPDSEVVNSSIAHSGKPLRLSYLADLLLDEWSPYLCQYLLPLLSTPRLRAITLSAHTCDPKHLQHLELSPPDRNWQNVRFIRARGCAFNDAVVSDFLNLAPNAESVLVHGGLLTDRLLDSLSKPSAGGQWMGAKLRSAYLHTRLRFSQEATMRFIDARLPPPPPPVPVPVMPVQQTAVKRRPSALLPTPPKTALPTAQALTLPLTPQTPNHHPARPGLISLPVMPLQAALSPALPPTPTSPLSPAYMEQGGEPSFSPPRPHTPRAESSTSGSGQPVASAGPALPEFGRVRYFAPTPLRLLGIFGLPHSPSPAFSAFAGYHPSAAVVSGLQALSSAAGPSLPAGLVHVPVPRDFRTWLAERVGPEAHGVPNWIEFRRQVLEQVASGEPAFQPHTVPSLSGEGAMQPVSEAGVGLSHGGLGGTGGMGRGGAAAVGGEEGVRFYGEGVGVRGA